MIGRPPGCRGQDKSPRICFRLRTDRYAGNFVEVGRRLLVGGFVVVRFGMPAVEVSPSVLYPCSVVLVVRPFLGVLFVWAVGK